MVIALLGFGVVGRGFYEILQDRTDMKIKKIFGRRIYPGYEALCTTDINDVIEDEEIDTVIEVMGGVEPAFEYVSLALRAGKNVVTANKQLIIQHYGSLINLASENDVSLRYSAAVGGGVPWLISLERAHRISRVYEISGIMNGTTNFILDEMTENGSDFDEVLKIAQEKGFAEADPSSDIDAVDVRRKIAISANVAFGLIISENEVDAFGIRNIKKCDIEAAKALGKVAKLLGRAKRNDSRDGVSVWAEPCFVSDSEPESRVHGAFNMITFDCRFAGKESFYGQGAGGLPTGYAVAHDCLDIQSCRAGLYNWEMRKASPDNSKVSFSYYVRTENEDFVDKYCTQKLCSGFITKKLPVSVIHAFARSETNAGREFFFASIQ